jgi:hypothetical protein
MAAMAQLGDGYERDLLRTLRSCTTFLARWRGARVESSSRPWPPGSWQLLLTRDGSDGNLLLICGEHRRIRGPARWDAADLVVVRDRLPEALRAVNAGRDGFRLIDRGAGVELVTARLSVFENVKRTRPGPPVRPHPTVVDPADADDDADRPRHVEGQYVRVVLNEDNRTARHGTIRAAVWHHQHRCWYYLLRDSAGRAVGKRFAARDLQPWTPPVATDDPDL